MTDTRISERPIGPGHGVYVVAEIGSNHGGDLVLAKKTIEAAARPTVDGGRARRPGAAARTAIGLGKPG
jgi:hypothetical protein